MLKLKIDNEYNNMYMVFFSLEKKKKLFATDVNIPYVFHFDAVLLV